MNANETIKEFLKSRKGEQRQGAKYYKREWKNNRWKYWYTKTEYDSEHPATHQSNHQTLISKLLQYFNIGESSSPEHVAIYEYKKKNIGTDGISLPEWTRHFTKYFEFKEKYDARFAEEEKLANVAKNTPVAKEMDETTGNYATAVIAKTESKTSSESGYKSSIFRKLYHIYGKRQNNGSEIIGPAIQGNTGEPVSGTQKLQSGVGIYATGKNLQNGEQNGNAGKPDSIRRDSGIGFGKPGGDGRIRLGKSNYYLQQPEDKEEKKKELLGQEPVIIDSSWLPPNLNVKDRLKISKDEFDKIRDETPITKDGRKVKFSTKGFKEIFFHSADNRTISVIPQLPELLQKGTYLWSESNMKNEDKNIIAYHNYSSKVRINGKDEFIRIIIRENNNGDYFYDNEFVESEIINKGSAPPTNQGRKLSPLKSNLYQWWNSVNNNNYLVPHPESRSEAMKGNQNAKKDDRSLPEKINDSAIDAVSGVKQKWSQKKQAEINEKCKQILSSTPPYQITDEQKEILRRYEGSGGQTTNKDAEATRGMLYQFFTPRKVISKMQEIVSRYVKPDVDALEPAAGIGRFAENTNYRWDMLEYNPDDNTAYQIARILHPDANVSDNAFETMFIDKKNRSLGNKYSGKKYGLVAGNPPYGAMTGRYKAIEGKGYKRYEHYFISRGLDTLEEGGVLAYVVPSSFMNAGEENWKKEIFEKAELLESYRLPEGSFGNTGIGTDIIILRKNSSNKKDNKLVFGGKYFQENPEHIIGSEEKRINRFGREETFIKGNVEDFIALELPKPKEPMSQETKNSISEGLKGNKNAEKSTKAIKKEKIQDSSSIIDPRNLYTQAEFNKKFNKSFDEKDIEIVRNMDPIGRIKNLPFDKDRMALVEGRNGEFDFVPAYIYQSGNIKDKLFALEKSKDSIINKYGEEQYHRQKKALESATPKKIDMSKLVLSPLEPFVQSLVFQDGKKITEKFFDYVLGTPVYRDYGYSRGLSHYEGGLPREYFQGTDCSAMDIKSYTLGEKVTGRDAEENQRRRKERKIQAEKLFKQFINEILSDEDQKELSEKWNDQFNSVAKIDSNKIPVVLEGMNRKYKDKDQDPRGIQMRFVGEYMTKGVGCATHEVGLGKTWTGMMANVSSIQTGKAKKPLIVVPTSVLQKWALEFKERFPNVKSQMIGTPELNDQLKSNSGKFEVDDGTVTIMSYDAFQRFGFSENRFNELTNDLKDQIVNPDNEKGKRGKAQDDEQIQELVGVATIGTEAALKFDDAGFDMITVDEAHNFNNIFVDIKKKDQLGGVNKLSSDEEEASVKANEFSGITSGSPSARGIKLYLAAQHILKENQDRNVLLLTATPFTNNPLQVYSLLSIVAKKRLRDMGIYNIRDFIATFVETTWENTIEGNGEIKQKQVVRNFKNGHAFQSLVREYFDFQQGDENGVERPELKMKAVVLPLSEEQKLMRDRLEEMYDEKDPSGKPSGAAPLVSIGTQQMMGISPALVKPGKADIWKKFSDINHLGTADVVERSPKLKFIADSIAGLYYKHRELRPGEPIPGQIMFMPKGVEHIQKIKQYLVDQGIPGDAIEIMDTKTKTTPARDSSMKAKGLSRFTEITKDFNNPDGKCRIILGTDVIKEGVSLNKYTGIAYNTSIDWNPTTEVQKRGRAHRPGNKLKKTMWVDVLMEDSIDSKLYQKQGEKISRINDIFKNTGSPAIDVSEINPDELKYDIIKDPERKAKLVLQEESGRIRAQAKDAQSRAFAVQGILDDLDEAENLLDSRSTSLKESLDEVPLFMEYIKNPDKYEESGKEVGNSWWRYDDEADFLKENKAEIDKIKKDISALKTKISIKTQQLERKSFNAVETARAFVKKSQDEADRLLEQSRELQTTKKDEYIEKFKKELKETEAKRVKFSLSEIVTNHIAEVLEMLGVKEIKKSGARAKIIMFNFLKSKKADSNG